MNKADIDELVERIEVDLFAITQDDENYDHTQNVINKIALATLQDHQNGMVSVREVNQCIASNRVKAENMLIHCHTQSEVSKILGECE